MMTPMYAFTCDGCGAEDSLVVQNTPVAQRVAPPEGWTTLKVGDDMSTPAKHLCGSCSGELTQLISGAKRDGPPRQA
jgi:hypothetical protein